MGSMIQCQLLPYARLVFAQGGDATTDRRHMLTDAQVDPLNERGVDLPATGHQHLLDRLQRAEHDAVLHADQTAPPHGLDHLRIEQTRQGYPAWLGGWP